MKSRRIMFFLILIAIATLVISGCATSPTPEKDTNTPPKLSDKRYNDSNGHFTVVPPEGWEIREYPNRNPTSMRGISIWKESSFLVFVTSPANYANSQDFLAQIKRELANQGVRDPIIEQTNFKGNPAVKTMYTTTISNTKIYDIRFFIDRIEYRLGYAALDNDSYNKWLPIAMKSMETYEPIRSSK